MYASTRDRILTAGADLVRKQGFKSTGLSEILEAANVPKGSFYHYFKSKDAFGLELVDFFYDSLHERSARYLDDPGIPPLKRMRLFFEDMRRAMEAQGFSAGCPIGNLCQEMSGVDEDFRRKLDSIMVRLTKALARLIGEARETGEARGPASPEDMAAFIVNAWEGSLIRMKAARSAEPLKLFETMVFERLLA